jgi:hypothetical protein
MEDAIVFTLTIPVTPTSVEAIKAELTKSLPGVKSSHRCEAVARGLGYRTYASLLSATRGSVPHVATAEGATFISYLASHDFQVTALPFYRAAARVALRTVLEKQPRLTQYGIGVGEWQRRSDGSWETGAERRARLIASRESMLTDYEIEPFLLSLALLSRVERTKTIRPHTNSYWLKHIAEEYACTYPEGEKLGPQYVPNGIFIAAAVHAGFDIKTHTDYRGNESLNVTFNMSKPSLLALEYEIRPDSGRSQDRKRRIERRELKRRQVWVPE